METTGTRRPTVLVVGAGFGGLWTARELAGEPVEVVVLDRNNFHTFYPLLYQVGTAELDGTEMVYPIRKIFRPWDNVHFRMGEVRRVDLGARRVETERRAFDYDHLVLATGSRTDWLGVEGAEENAYPLKELADGIALRNHVLSCFEAAAQEDDPERRRRLLTFAVVGGGSTGVELAGALAELALEPMSRDYEEFGRDDIRILLVEAEDRLLPGIPETLGRYARRRLERMGVEVRLAERARRVEPEALRLSEAEAVDTETVMWTAGVRGEAPFEAPGLPVTERGWVRVGADLRVEGHAGAWAVGDLALVDGVRLPLVAPAAIQQGEHVARNVLRELRGEPAAPFEYHDKGILGTIGRHAAYARARGLDITGFPAWLVWLVIHVRQLIGFRNRLVVLINWAWDYFLAERPVRWIMPGWRETLLGGRPLGPQGSRAGLAAGLGEGNATDVSGGAADGREESGRPGAAGAGPGA